MTVWPISVTPGEVVAIVALLVVSTACGAQCEPVALSGESSAASFALAPLEVIFSALAADATTSPRARPWNDEALIGPPPAAAVAGQVMVNAVTAPGLSLAPVPFSQASKNARPPSSSAATSLGWLAAGA